MQLSFAGKKWTLKRPAKLTLDGEGCYGRCDYHTRTILVLKRLLGFDELDTFIHEGIHAICEIIDESFVGCMATDLANLLWRLGYRKLSRAQRKALGIE